MKPLDVRFWAKVDKTDHCWNWTGNKNVGGYGCMKMPGGEPGRRPLVYAHRVSYELHKGPIPDGLVVDHICHNKSCVNPEHLRACTVKENVENHSGARRDSRSGIRGVSWHKAGKKWRASVTHQGRDYYLGLFHDPSEAEAAVIAKRNELFTHNDLDRVHP